MTSVSPGIHIDTILSIEPINWLAGGLVAFAFLRVVLESLLALARRLRKRRAAPEPVFVPLAAAWFATHLAVMTALILLGLAALCAMFLDREVAASLFRALVMVLVIGFLTAVALSALEWLFRLARRAVRRRPVSPAPPSGS